MPNPTVSKNTPALALGDIVQAHGSRFRLVSVYWAGDASSPQGRGYHTEYLGPVWPDRSESIPPQWRTVAQPWAIQGNELAFWAVEI